MRTRKVRASLVTQMVNNLPANKTQETQVWSLGQEDPPEKGMATYSSILVWRIPWTEEPGRLWSMESQRVGHDWASNTLLLKTKPSPQLAFLWFVIISVPGSLILIHYSLVLKSFNLATSYFGHEYFSSNLWCEKFSLWPWHLKKVVWVGFGF